MDNRRKSTQTHTGESSAQRKDKYAGASKSGEVVTSAGLVAESSATFRTMFDSIKDGIVLTDLRGVILKINDATLRLHGLDNKEALIGKKGIDLIAKKDRVRVGYSIGKMIEDGAPRTLTLSLLANNRRMFQAESNLSLLRDGEGKPSGIIAVSRDVTERRENEEKTARYARRVESLYAIAQTVSQTLDLQLLLDNALGRVLEVMGISTGCVYLLDYEAKELALQSCAGIPKDLIREIDRIKLDEDEIFRTAKFSNFSVALEEVFNEHNATLIRKLGARKRLGLVDIFPLWARGKVQGILCLSEGSRPQTADRDINLLSAMCNQIAVAIENAFLYKRTKEQAEQLAVISELTGIIGSSINLTEVFDTFIRGVKRLVDYDRVTVTLADGDRLRFFAVATEVDSEWPEGGISIPIEGSVTQWAISSRCTNIETDFIREKMFPIDYCHETCGLRSAIRVPLFYKGEVFGTFNMISMRPDAYGAREREILEQLAGPLAAAVINHQLVSRMTSRENEREKAGLN